MADNGPRYDHALRAAAEVISVLKLSEPEAEQFGRVLFLILDAMYAADAELNGRIYEPSED